jgi:RNA polymerase sigma-70 factor (ECF subfamily)
MAALTESHKEQLLVERVRAKDQQAFGELVERYQKSLYNVIFGVVGDVERTEDVLQETFLRAYRFIERYDASFRFSTWLFRIGVNLGISSIRRRRLEFDVFSPAGIAHHGLLRQSTSDSPVDELLRVEQGERVMEAIGDLSERYRTILTMRFAEGMSCRDIGQQIGISANSVSIVLHRCKLKLREFLKTHDSEDPCP